MNCMCVVGHPLDPLPGTHVCGCHVRIRREGREREGGWHGGTGREEMGGGRCEGMGRESVMSEGCSMASVLSTPCVKYVHVLARVRIYPLHS